MSFDIIKGINFKGGVVNIKAGCSNVYPRTQQWCQCGSLTLILNQQGKAAVEKAILREYWNGNFQQGNNVYDKTVRYFKSRLPYTFDNTGPAVSVGTKRYDALIIYSFDQLEQALYDSLQEFKKRDKKQKWIIRLNLSFLRKKTSRWLFYTSDINTAITFKSKIDAWLYHAGGNIVLKNDKSNIWYENI